MSCALCLALYFVSQNLKATRAGYIPCDRCPYIVDIGRRATIKTTSCSRVTTTFRVRQQGVDTVHAPTIDDIKREACKRPKFGRGKVKSFVVDFIYCAQFFPRFVAPRLTLSNGIKIDFGMTQKHCGCQAPACAECVVKWAVELARGGKPNNCAFCRQEWQGDITVVRVKRGARGLCQGGSGP